MIKNLDDLKKKVYTKDFDTIILGLEGVEYEDYIRGILGTFLKSISIFPLNAEALSDEGKIKHALLEYLPRNLFLEVFEVGDIILILLRMYWVLEKEKIISTEQAQRAEYLIFKYHEGFCRNMDNPMLYSKAKLSFIEWMRNGGPRITPELSTRAITSPEISNTKTGIFSKTELKVVGAESDPKFRPSGYQIRVELVDVKPKSWRRLLIPGRITYKQLHDILQIAFDWENTHAYAFKYHDQVVFQSDNESTASELPSNSARIIDQDFELGETLFYTYDLAHPWRHKIEVESILIFSTDLQTGPVLENAVGGTPPEADAENQLRVPLDREKLGVTFRKYWMNRLTVR